MLSRNTTPNNASEAEADIGIGRAATDAVTAGKSQVLAEKSCNLPAVSWSGWVPLGDRTVLLDSVREMRSLEPPSEAPAPTETAVIVPVPAAEPVVGQYRRYLDSSAGWGVPAHVTVLYPFVEPTALDQHVLAKLQRAVRMTRAFACQFKRTRWFGEDVLWLDPVPAEPFRQLTTAVWDAFPDYPPYGGAHHDPIPHLTIAERASAGLRAMRAAERTVQSRLPVSTVIDRVLLIAGAQAADSWRPLHEISLTD